MEIRLWVLLLYLSEGQVFSLADLAAQLPTPGDALGAYLAVNNTGNYTTLSVAQSTYMIEILIDPCPVSNVYCCQGQGEAACVENTVVEGGSSLIVVWASNNFVVNCANEFATSLECGTYLEIHRPGKFTDLSDTQVIVDYASGFQTQFLSTHTLCAGPYEVWWVVRTRSGRMLLYVKPFFLSYPSCSDAQVLSAQQEV